MGRTAMHSGRSFLFLVAFLLLLPILAAVFGLFSFTTLTSSEGVFGSIKTSIGGVEGDPENIQRLRYDAYVTQHEKGRLDDWDWQVIVAPEIQERLLSSEHHIEPLDDDDGGTGNTLRLYGEFIFSSEDMSKEEIHALESIVTIKGTSPNGRQTFHLGGRL